MTRLRGIVAGAAGLAVLTGCAGPATGIPTSTAASAPASVPGAPGSALVLRVAHEGGFVAADTLAGRLPAVSVYADGRIITEGARIDIYPGPALPALQVQQVGPELIADLVAGAGKAGVRAGVDFGTPGVADAPDTRVTVTTAEGTRSVTVPALSEAQADDPYLTAAQSAARAKLVAYVDRVTGLATSTALPAPVPYRPESIAALARPYQAPSDGLPSQPPALRWPGPDLPGEPLTAGRDLGCVTATGARSDEVLAVADRAVRTTGWTSAGGTWSVVLRPLLPDETGCADLRAAR